tara:strand:+ start:1734 stop:2654 length:921 start_codon:yes stop_codon:yes gene_type:complete
MASIAELINDFDQNAYSINSTIDAMNGKLINHGDRRRFHNYKLGTFYLLDVKLLDNEYSLKICGTIYNIYDVRISKTDCKIKCDCPDSLGYCHANGTICKHSYFVLLSVLRMRELAESDFWQTKKFSEVEIQIIFDRIHKIWERRTIMNINYINQSYISSYSRYNTTQARLTGSSGEARVGERAEGDEDTDIAERNAVSTGHENAGGTEEEPKGIDKFKIKENTCTDELCPVCYEEMNDPKDIVRCPTCKKYMHEECIKAWFQTGKSTCVMCRSPVWQEYLQLMKAAMPTDIYNRNYTNLYDTMVG